MKKSTKIALIIAGVLVVTGIIMMVIGSINDGMAAICWDREEHKLVVYNKDEILHSQSKVKIDEFDSILIDSWDADVEFIPSDDYYIEYCVSAPKDFDYEIVDGRLTFMEDNSRYFYLTLSNIFEATAMTDDRYVKIYYPRDAAMRTVEVNLEMGSLDIDYLNMEYANIELEMGELDVEASDINVMCAALDMGGMDIDDSNIGSMTADLDMGGIELENTSIENSMTVSLEMGSVDAELVRTDGNGKSIEYGYKMDTDMGSIKVDGKVYDESLYSDGKVMINITCDMGSIELKLR